jgi:hypothetical protein
MYYKKTILLFLFAAANIKLMAQANPSIAVLPSNNGIVAVGATISVRIDVGNTDVGSINQSKLRPIVTLPASVTFLSTAEQTLPTGWSILTNTGSQIRFCNSSTTVGPQSNTEINLLVRGVTITAPQTFSGQIAFGNGTTCASGTSVTGDQTADNTATSTIEVIAAPLPLTLLSFNASLNNCQPALKWVTESEINTDRFEIESKAANNSSSWASVATIPAKGSLAKSSYNYADINIVNNGTRVLYRLKMIDKDGSYKYSDVLPVLVECNKIQALAYPNPVQDGKLYVSVTGTNGKTEGALRTIAGQLVKRINIINGTNNIDVAGIANGTYLLTITSANGLDKKIKVMINN